MGVDYMARPHHTPGPFCMESFLVLLLNYIVKHPRVPHQDSAMLCGPSHIRHVIQTDLSTKYLISNAFIATQNRLLNHPHRHSSWQKHFPGWMLDRCSRTSHSTVPIMSLCISCLLGRKTERFPIPGI